MLQTKKIEYKDGDTILEGYCAYDDTTTASRPAVLIIHDWSGLNDFARQKAEKLAEIGYVGFAIDIYGKGKIGQSNDEKMALMTPFIEDRSKLRRRLIAAFEAAKKLDYINTAKMGAIGFCFGGLCALDLARANVGIQGAVSFHGFFTAPSELPTQAIDTKILALHGHEDPSIPPAQIAAFEQEMTLAGADWQLHIYSHTKHGFTNPQANDSTIGILYNPVADKRAWIAMKNFLAEVLE